ncbi:MAG: Gfo/Idh/MocA family oxidoreductase [Bryobacterales bacterium]|nr:Gfo/Idh/MocA family oxidoreductase [Bryobacterales bacterium]
MRIVGLGIIGCGDAARRYHAPALRKIGGIRVVSLHDALPQNAHELAGSFPTARLAASPQDLLTHPEVEAVAILTPPATHFELARMALLAGKHVLVEKPLALEEAHAEELEALAGRAGLIGAVGFHLRNHRLVQRAKTLLRERHIGAVRIARSLWCARMQPSNADASWRQRPSEGGSLLDDVGIHHVDLLPYVLGAEIREVRASVSDEGPTGRHARLSLGAAGGVSLDVSLVEGRFEWQELEIVGERGRITLSLYDAWGFEALSSAHPTFGLGARASRLLRSAAGIPEGLSATLQGGDLAACYSRQWEQFGLAITAGAAPAASFADGLASLRVIRRARQEELLRGARKESSQEILLRPTTVAQRAAAQSPAEESVYAPPQPHEGPPLSVVLSSPGEFHELRTTLRHLAAQTARNQIELILVAPESNSFDVDQTLAGNFFAMRVVRVPAIGSIAEGNAAGVRAARGRVIVFSEDHCFPEPGWAAALIEAHRAPHAVVGPVVRNANPDTSISWADFLAGYGPWIEGSVHPAIDFLPGHNSSYKREALHDLGGALETALEAETLLHQRLARDGASLHLEPRAVVSHVNFALPNSFADAQFLNGRMFAGMRSRQWGIGKRICYFCASPAIPAVRMLRSIPAWRSLPVGPGMKAKVFLALLFGLIVDGTGQMIGYAAGPGSAREKLARLEFHRYRHIPPRERDAIFT